MSSALSYPGVYIEEIPSGVRTITGVATSITAFIGRASRGPVNEPVIINSFADFERVFGGLWAESTLGYAVRDFYVNGGSQAIIVRLLHPNFATEGEEKSAIEVVTNISNDIKSEPTKALALAKADEIKEDQTKTELERKVAGDIYESLAELADEATEEDIKKATDDAIDDIIPRKGQLTAGKENEITLEAVSAGSWGNSIRARVDHDLPKKIPESFESYGLALTDLFNLSICDMKGGVTEVFLNLSIKPSPRSVVKVLENESRLVRVVKIPEARPEETDAELKTIAEGDDAAEAKKAKEALRVPPFRSLEEKRSIGVDQKGTDGKNLDSNDFIGPNLEDNKKGLFALSKTDLFNILCIPPYSFMTDIGTDLIAKAIEYSEKRRAIYLIDPPSNWNNKEEAKKKFTAEQNDYPGTRSKNGALFFPRLKQPNPLKGGQVEEFVPCGVVAGVFARTDVQRGVWKAPAGLDAALAGVPELSVPLTDAENGELNLLGINCLRSKPGAGRVIWGTRTLQGDDRLSSEWKYIPIRRLALFIEESLYRGTQWVVFEPNDEPLWAQIRLNVGAFMHNLFRRGAFQGSTSREAYFVKCDKETTPQNDIDQGIVNIVVGFAPLKPAEFVVIKIQQIAGQIQT